MREGQTWFMKSARRFALWAVAVAVAACAGGAPVSAAVPPVIAGAGAGDTAGGSTGTEAGIKAGTETTAAASFKPRNPTVVVGVRAVGTSLWIKMSMKAGSNTTYLADTASTNSGSQKMGHVLSVTSGQSIVDSFDMGRPAAGITKAGFACVRGVGPGGLSPNTACKPWTYTEPVVAPTDPSMDSIKAIPASYRGTTPTGQTVIFPASGNMTPGTTTARRLYCAFGFMADGSVHRGLIPTTQDYTTRVQACDSLGRALWNVRYSLRGVRLPGTPIHLALK